MSKKKILLVDDSSTVLMMERVLLGDRYDVILAHNGRQAVSAAVAEKPDLIFMDVSMPQMNGYEACRALRATPETKATPVIMVTTKGQPFDVRQGFEAGCTEYVTKPIRSLELMAKLKAYLGE